VGGGGGAVLVIGGKRAGGAAGVSGGMAIEERSPGWVRERGGAAARDGSLFLRESFFRVLAIAMGVRIFVEEKSGLVALDPLRPKQNFRAELTFNWRAPVKTFVCILMRVSSSSTKMYSCTIFISQRLRYSLIVIVYVLPLFKLIDAPSFLKK
jgi:hypothetical protein